MCLPSPGSIWSLWKTKRGSWQRDSKDLQSGPTGDPLGVMISNDGILTLIAGVKLLLESVNEKLVDKDVYLSYLPLARIFDRMIEEAFIYHGASIGFWCGRMFYTFLSGHCRIQEGKG